MIKNGRIWNVESWSASIKRIYHRIHKMSIGTYISYSEWCWFLITKTFTVDNLIIKNEVWWIEKWFADRTSETMSIYRFDDNHSHGLLILWFKVELCIFGKRQRKWIWHSWGYFYKLHSLLKWICSRFLVPVTVIGGYIDTHSYVTAVFNVLSGADKYLLVASKETTFYLDGISFSIELRY